MIDLIEIRDRLQADVTALRAVGLAKEFGQARGNALTWPSAFILPLAESAGPNRYQTCDLIDQRIEARFTVILAVRDIGARTSERAIEGLNPLRTAIFSSLGTYVPTGADSACTPRQGRIVSGVDRDGGLLWQDDFNVAFNRRIPS